MEKISKIFNDAENGHDCSNTVWGLLVYKQFLIGSMTSLRREATFSYHEILSDEALMLLIITTTVLNTTRWYYANKWDS